MRRRLDAPAVAQSLELASGIGNRLVEVGGRIGFELAEQLQTANRARARQLILAGTTLAAHCSPRCDEDGPDR